MKPFTYARPDDAQAAVAAVGADPGATFLAGGTNLLDHLKLGVATPSALVDVARVTSAEIIEHDDGGLIIGAGALNTDVAAHPAVRRDYPALAQALLAGASGQLRNIATTGGNLLQRTRCAYFADVTTPCTKRSLDQACSAREGWARYHAILGASPSCIATHPSDMAVALVALDATVHVPGPDGGRSLPIPELHRLPGDDPDPRHRPRPRRARHRRRPAGLDARRELRLPQGPRPRLVRVRARLRGRCPRGARRLRRRRPPRARRGRAQAVAGHPAEAALRGAPATDESFRAAARAELADAEPVETPLGGNGFKLDLVVGAVTETLRRLATTTAREPA